MAPFTFEALLPSSLGMNPPAIVVSPSDDAVVTVEEVPTDDPESLLVPGHLPVPLHPDFRYPGDVVLVSAERVGFRLMSGMLRVVSDTFAEMIDSTAPSGPHTILHTSDPSEHLRTFLILLNLHPPSGEFIPRPGDYEIMKHLMTKYKTHPWAWGVVYSFFETRLIRSIGASEHLWSVRMAHVLRSSVMWKAIVQVLRSRDWRRVNPTTLEAWEREFLGGAYDVLARVAMMGSVDGLFDIAHRLCVGYDDAGEASVVEGEVVPRAFDERLTMYRLDILFELFAEEEREGNGAITV